MSFTVRVVFAVKALLKKGWEVARSGRYAVELSLLGLFTANFLAILVYPYGAVYSCLVIAAALLGTASVFCPSTWWATLTLRDRRLRQVRRTREREEKRELAASRETLARHGLLSATEDYLVALGMDPLRATLEAEGLVAVTLAKAKRAVKKTG